MMLFYTPSMRLILITSNPGKAKELKKYLEPEIEIEHVNMKYEELRNDAPEEIAKESAKRLAEELKKPLIVEDSGLFIKSLNDFPGTCSAYIHKRIGLEGILKLMERIQDRRCTYKSAVAFCEPGASPISFLGEEKGMIADKIRGAYGFGHDQIFIPEDSDKTYGEMK